MPRWIFEPGHSAAGFRVRHMMVTWVRGHFKDVHGSLDFDPERPKSLMLEAVIDAARLWSGEPARDDHLRSADFLDVPSHPSVKFKGTSSTCVGPSDYKVTGDLTIRGITQPVTLDMQYLGQWITPYWTDKGNAGDIPRVGFVGRTRIDRLEFGVNWNGELGNHGLVVGDEVFIDVDVEGLLESRMKELGVLP